MVIRVKQKKNTTMKKIYNSPLIKIVKVGPMLMSVTSQVHIGSNYNGSADIESRRGGSIWDDEEEY